MLHIFGVIGMYCSPLPSKRVTTKRPQVPAQLPRDTLPENRHSQKEPYLPTTRFQVRAVRKNSLFPFNYTTPRSGVPNSKAHTPISTNKVAICLTLGCSPKSSASYNSSHICLGAFGMSHPYQANKISYDDRILDIFHLTRHRSSHNKFEIMNFYMNHTPSTSKKNVLSHTIQVWFIFTY